MGSQQPVLLLLLLGTYTNCDHNCQNVISICFVLADVILIPDSREGSSLARCIGSVEPELLLLLLLRIARPTNLKL